jgi:7-cyano-7-deazaguanine synthase in queuosine biosynthesis
VAVRSRRVPAPAATQTPEVAFKQHIERQIVTKKCKCHRSYSYYEGDRDPGECHLCQIRKH